MQGDRLLVPKHGEVLASRLVWRDRGAALIDGATILINAGSHRCDRLALTKHEDEANNENYDAGRHQDVADKRKNDHIVWQVDRKREDRTNDEQTNSGSYTHASKVRLKRPCGKG